MIQIPVYRWGEAYQSMETEELVHFATGEPVAKLGLANGGMVQRDLRKASRARQALRKFPVAELVEICAKAADLYLNATLPIGDGKQSPDDFVRQQSATTGLPESLCRANMKKNHFVLSEMGKILDSLTRRLDLSILSRGHGVENGVPVSYQANSPILGLVLPSNSPGVHTLWLPVLPMQVGLVMKPGSQEIWTPYRMAQAFWEAGIPREAIALYPGKTDVGATILAGSGRSMIFGGAATVELYKSNPRVQVHGPGFSKILFGDDLVDRWEDYLDMLVESVFTNGGRGCINASGIWVSRHGREIAEAIAKKLAAVSVLPPDDPNATLAAFTVPGAAKAISQAIDQDLQAPGVTDVTAKFRDGGRLVEKERCGYLLPTVVHCTSPEPKIANQEYMFPFVSVVECPLAKMIETIGPTLVCTALSNDEAWRDQLLESTHIDRLNFGPIPTTRLNWLQPHEGNIVEFLFRARAFQSV